MKQKYSLFLILSFALLACRDEEIKAPIPAYLTINDILVKNSDGSGFQSDNITDAKVFIDGQSIGTFDLPTSIPIQKTGAVNLKIRAGILKNGRSADKTDYPFYTTYEEDIIFEKEKDITRKPIVEYFSTVKLANDWSGEDFESGVNFIPNPSSDAVIIRETNPDDVFDFDGGIASGAAYLTKDQDFFETWTSRIFDIPRRTDAVYLELNYKSSHDFLISVYTNNEQTQLPAVFFRANPNWTKVYVELGNIFSLLFTANNYTIGIGYTKPLGEEGALFLDNVKLVHL